MSLSPIVSSLRSFFMNNSWFGAVDPVKEAMHVKKLLSSETAGFLSDLCSHRFSNSGRTILSE